MSFPASGSGGGAELDPVTFSDQSFPSFISLGQHNQLNDEVGFETSSPLKTENEAKKMRNAEVLTEVLYYADAETNTKHRKKDAEIQVEKNLNMAVLGENDDEGYYDEDERIA